MRRPAVHTPAWDHFAWQVRTYAWLRAQQAGSAPVVAAILLFVNELEPSQNDIEEVKKEAQSAATDVLPAPRDQALLTSWRPSQPVPALSTTFREQRSVRVIEVDPARVHASLSEFDDVVADIERVVMAEMQGGSVINAWKARPSRRPYSAPDLRACTACDHKHYCPMAPSVKVGGVPKAP